MPPKMRKRWIQKSAEVLKESVINGVLGQDEAGTGMTVDEDDGCEIIGTGKENEAIPAKITPDGDMMPAQCPQALRDEKMDVDDDDVPGHG